MVGIVIIEVTLVHIVDVIKIQIQIVEVGDRMDGVELTALEEIVFVHMLIMVIGLVVVVVIGHIEHIVMEG